MPARIGHFIDWYNFQRPHSGIGGLVPADRFFGAAPEVLHALKERVAANALELARNGLPKPPFYVTGQLGGKNFSLHAEGERVFLTREGGLRQEVDLVPPAALADSAAMPKAICPDGSPAAGLLGDAPAQMQDAPPPEGPHRRRRRGQPARKEGSHEDEPYLGPATRPGISRKASRGALIARILPAATDGGWSRGPEHRA